ncbi:MFS transporter [Tahibacter caeni]|uniref:MFS transporter n=1 Tax=Tahibacter caeni TaxID=1453545 RepID=UPI002147290D|nr:MFS transporter [Tahibacter caeni]
MPTAVPTLRLSSFYFMYYAVLGGFTPYWSLYLKDRGQDAAAIGLLMSLWYATRIVAPSSWNWLAARSARPIRWLHLGCLASVASFCAFLLPLDFAGLFAAMCVFCFFHNATMPQFEAITLSHLHGIAERYGTIRVWGSIGFIGIVALFGFLLDHLAVAWLPLLMLPLLLGTTGSAFANDYGPAQRSALPAAGAEFRARLRRPEVIAFFLVCLLVQLSFGPLYTFFSLYLEQHGYKPSALGLFWAIGVTVEVFVFFLSPRLFLRWPAQTVLVVAVASAAVRWLVTALFPDSVVVMTLAQLTHAVNFAAFFASVMQLMAQYFPGPLGGHGQGVFYGFSSGVGGALGALIAGQAWRWGGGELAFEVAAAFAAIAALIAWRWVRPVPAQAVANG